MRRITSPCQSVRPKFHPISRTPTFALKPSVNSRPAFFSSSIHHHQSIRGNINNNNNHIPHSISSPKLPIGCSFPKKDLKPTSIAKPVCSSSLSAPTCAKKIHSSSHIHRLQMDQKSPVNNNNNNNNNNNTTPQVDTPTHSPVDGLHFVREQIAKAKKKYNITRDIRLVAVSKTKPNELISECYDLGAQIHFGENYVNELVQKAKTLPTDIRWHFIGLLQSNKAKTLCEIPNLWMIESVHSKKLAKILNSCVEGRANPLNIMVQINTSGEDSKSGCAPAECLEIVKYVLSDCPHLKFCGLMTIGDPLSPPEKPDWKVLLDCKRQVIEKAGVKDEEIELSFGMSNDFVQAIEWGATNVRVGSTIFGARDYSKKQ